MEAHFFDIDTLIKVDNKVWIVDMDKPFIPLLKIDKPDFNLIRSGIYKKDKNSVKLNDVGYWFPEDVYNNLKVRVTKHRANMSNLSFSMQEFLNPAILDKISFKIHGKHIEHLKNTLDDVYIICSKNTKKNYNKILDRLEEKLELKVEKYYFVSDTFYNTDKDEMAYKKAVVLLKHLFGYDIENKSFIQEQVKEYDTVFFYECDEKSIQQVKEMNNLLEFILNKSEDHIKKMIKDKLSEKKITLKKVNFNNANVFSSENILLEWDNVIKTFESFKRRFK